MAYLIYVEGFEQGRGLGYACAIAVILLALIMSLYLFQRRFTELDESRAVRSGPPGGIRGWLMQHLGRERGGAGVPTGA